MRFFRRVTRIKAFLAVSGKRTVTNEEGMKRYKTRQNVGEEIFSVERKKQFAKF